MAAAKYLTAQQWAEERQVPISTVWRQIRQGRIRAVKHGSGRRPDYRIPESERARYDRDNPATS